MSVYNGGQYLRAQLDSIVAQTISPIALLIRDDGSVDNTVKIIQEYQNFYPWISYYKGENIGVQKSFLDLIAKSDPEADYLALSDQDDEWLPEKLQRALTCLKKLENGQGSTRISVDHPILYCSDKQIVDQELNPLHVTVSRIVRSPSFGNALVQNICTGCTAVMNRALANLINSHPPVCYDSMVMHDWWLYLTASCFGSVYYDDESFIRYRQHGNNTSGAMINQRNLLKYRIHQFFQPRGCIYRQAELFRDTYWQILKVPEIKAIQKLISAQDSLHNRILLSKDKYYFRQKWTDDLIYRGIVILGKL